MATRTASILVHVDAVDRPLKILARVPAARGTGFAATFRSPPPPSPPSFGGDGQVAPVDGRDLAFTVWGAVDPVALGRTLVEEAGVVRTTFPGAGAFASLRALHAGVIDTAAARHHAAARDGRPLRFVVRPGDARVGEADRLRHRLLVALGEACPGAVIAASGSFDPLGRYVHVLDRGDGPHALLLGPDAARTTVLCATLSNDVAAALARDVLSPPSVREVPRGTPPGP